MDNDLCQPDCGLSVWVYEESNGYPGLQRRDTWWADEDDNPWTKDDTCGGLIAPDTLIF